MADTKITGGSGGKGVPFLERHPYTNEDFSEENLAYRISAKEFFRMISSLNDRLSSLEEQVKTLQLELATYKEQQKKTREYDLWMARGMPVG